MAQSPTPGNLLLAPSGSVRQGAIPCRWGGSELFVPSLRRAERVSVACKQRRGKHCTPGYRCQPHAERSLSLPEADHQRVQPQYRP